MESGSIECSQARVETRENQAARRSQRDSSLRSGSVIMRPFTNSITCGRGRLALIAMGWVVEACT